MATLIQWDRKSREVSPRNQVHGFTRLELHALVESAHIEIASLDDGRVMVIPRDLLRPANDRAMKLYAQGRGSRFTKAIVGHVLVGWPGEIQ